MVAGTYVVERSTTVDALPQQIYDKISNFRNWAEWSPWEELDPDMSKTFEGQDGAVGSSYSWQGNRKAGQGKMTMAKLDAPNGATIDLQFLKPFKSESAIAFTLAPEGDATKVTWTMTGDHTLMSKIMGVFVSMDKLVGKDFEKGLTQLKAAAEA
jgi:hypothetical protein